MSIRENGTGKWLVKFRRRTNRDNWHLDLLSCFSALKSHDSSKYYINGNWVIDLPKGYEVAGTTVYYSRPRRNNGGEESFIAEGPTTEDLDIMVRRQSWNIQTS